MNKEGYSRTENSVDDWETPQYFFDLLDDKYHFTLDPCATKKNALCSIYYTINDDGLKWSWEGHTVFVNPPFKYIGEWSKKCYIEALNYSTTVVMILPSRTDTKYWHEYIMKADKIYFCKGRVNFLKGGVLSKAGSNFPLSVVIFKNAYTNHEYYPRLGVFYHKKVDILSQM